MSRAECLDSCGVDTVPSLAPNLREGLLSRRNGWKSRRVAAVRISLIGRDPLRFCCGHGLMHGMVAELS